MLQDWLKEINLEKYAQTLDDEGYDSVKMMIEMSPDEMQEMMEAVNMKRGEMVRVKNALKKLKPLDLSWVHMCSPISSQQMILMSHQYPTRDWQWSGTRKSLVTSMIRKQK